MDILEIGSRIREERIKRGMTQKKLGDDIGVSGSYIGKIERGECLPSVRAVREICITLNVSLDYIAFDLII